MEAGGTGAARFQHYLTFVLGHEGYLLAVGEAAALADADAVTCVDIVAETDAEGEIEGEGVGASVTTGVKVALGVGAVLQPDNTAAVSTNTATRAKMTFLFM